MNRLRDFLFQARDPRAVGLARVAWGLTVAAWAATLLPDAASLLDQDGLARVPRGPWSWSPPVLGWAPPFLVCLALVFAGISTCVGYRARASTLVAWLCLLTLERVNPLMNNSGDLLLRQIGLALALCPSDRALAVVAGRRAVADARTYWSIGALQLVLATGYFWSGWAKLRGATWHNGTAVELALRIDDMQRFAVPGALLRQTVLLNLVTWAVLAFELGFVFVVWRANWRPWLLAAGLALHVGIDLAIDVGFFSWAIVCVYCTFIPAELLDRLEGVVTQIRGAASSQRGESVVAGGRRSHGPISSEPLIS